MSKPSTSSLSVVPAATKMRLDPPSSLTEQEAVIWRDVVAAKPVDWFDRDGAPMLMEYCRATVMCDLLSFKIQALLVGDPDGELKDTLKLRDMESRRLTSLGTKLRLTQQSRYTPQAAGTATKRAAGGKKPWE